jgi:hypothetical protein
MLLCVRKTKRMKYIYVECHRIDLSLFQVASLQPFVEDRTERVNEHHIKIANAARIIPMRFIV